LSSNKGVSAMGNTSSPSISITFTANLSYTLSLTVADANGAFTTSTTVQIYRQPKAAFYAELAATGYPVKLNLTNYSTGSVAYFWAFTDGGPLDSAFNTSRQYAAPGNHTVTLTAKGLNGCKDVAAYTFSIASASSLQLPNIFTPNNDGVNEIYKPIMSGISELKAAVYNRYGLLVYAWDKVNGFWDGYTTSGLPCDDGMYFISVEAMGFDGQKYKLKSAITLVR